MNISMAISIASNALILIGDDPISSFSEDGVGARVANNFYEPTIRALLQSYPWTFAKKKVKLNRCAEAPLNDWEYMFQIPTDNIKILTVNRHVNYEIFEDKIMCNETDVDLDYVYRVDESFWSPLFREYVELYLASKWSIPVTENATALSNYAALAEQVRIKAKYDDAQSKPNRSAVDVARLPLMARHARRG